MSSTARPEKKLNRLISNSRLHHQHLWTYLDIYFRVDRTKHIAVRTTMLLSATAIFAREFDCLVKIIFSTQYLANLGNKNRFYSKGQGCQLRCKMAARVLSGREHVRRRLCRIGVWHKTAAKLTTPSTGGMYV